MIDNYWVYIVLALTITAIPGPATLLTMKNSIRYGRKVAVANILGNSLAMLLLATLSAVGLGAVILASSTLFYVLKVLGCCYLVYLGIKAWRAPYKGTEVFSTARSLPKGTVLTVFRQGFLVGVSNPKAIAFFVALFPQFINPTREAFPQYLTLILTIEGIAITVQMAYAFLSSAVAPVLSRERPMWLFNKFTGTAFMGFGLALLYEE